jgi:hypothetical protein
MGEHLTATSPASSGRLSMIALMKRVIPMTRHWIESLAIVIFQYGVCRNFDAVCNFVSLSFGSCRKLSLEGNLGSTWKPF